VVLKTVEGGGGGFSMSYNVIFTYSMNPLFSIRDPPPPPFLLNLIHSKGESTGAIDLLFHELMDFDLL
jgi:hypothetical protein